MNMKKILAVGMIALGVFGAFASAQAQAHRGKHSSEATVSLPVNINTATASQLKAVKSGLGQKKAEAIVAYRTANGNFSSVEDLKKIKGFSPKVLERLKGKLTV